MSILKILVSTFNQSLPGETLIKYMKDNLPSPMSYLDLVKIGLPDEILNEDNITVKIFLNVKDVKIIGAANSFR